MQPVEMSVSNKGHQGAPKVQGVYKLEVCDLPVIISLSSVEITPGLKMLLYLACALVGRITVNYSK